MDNKINFIGIGSGKSGSSWLWENIVKHPEISSYNAKEINFFSSLYEHKDVNWYHDLFESNNLVKGEFSVTYIDNNLSAQRIKSYSNEIKLICILRNPINRIVSDYYHSLRRGKINKNLTFDNYIKNDTNLAYGKYKSKIENYLKFFQKNQILIFEMEDCLKNKSKSLKKVYRFLNLNNPEYIPADLEATVNKGFVPKSIFLENVITFISQTLTKYGFIKFLEMLKKIDLHTLIRRYNSKYNLPQPSKSSIEYLRKYFDKDIKYFVSEFDFKNWK